MRYSRNERKYAAENFDRIWHTTLNPDGPGVVRIHLIPPKYSGNSSKDKDSGDQKTEIGSSVAIINGQDILPVNLAWSIVLIELMKVLEPYNGRELSDADMTRIGDETVRGVHRVYPFVSKKRITNDIYRIMETFRQVAYREPVDEEIGYMSMGEYAPFMRAPHRMDLMVSAMTKDGAWHCNQKCIHCYAAGQPQAAQTELTTGDWMKIIDKCRIAGIPQLTFTGGEPTMRADLVKLIEHAKWFITRLNTNGILLSKELCSRLRAASLDSMQITFYSRDKEIHNRLVGANRYDDTVAGIENALEAGISVSINTPLCTLNKDYVETLKFLHEKGVLYVTCSGLITTGNGATEDSQSLQLSTEEIRDILKEAVTYCFANGMEISFTSPGWIEESFFDELGITTPSCGACLSNMAITPAGDIVPCQSWLSGDVLGNMLTDSWEKVWESDACAKQREYAAEMLGECPLRRCCHE